MFLYSILCISLIVITCAQNNNDNNLQSGTLKCSLPYSFFDNSKKHPQYIYEGFSFSQECPEGAFGKRIWECQGDEGNLSLVEIENTCFKKPLVPNIDHLMVTLSVHNNIYFRLNYTDRLSILQLFMHTYPYILNNIDVLYSYNSYTFDENDYAFRTQFNIDILLASSTNRIKSIEKENILIDIKNTQSLYLTSSPLSTIHWDLVTSKAYYYPLSLYCPNTHAKLGELEYFNDCGDGFIGRTSKKCINIGPYFYLENKVRRDFCFPLFSEDNDNFIDLKFKVCRLSNIVSEPLYYNRYSRIFFHLANNTITTVNVYLFDEHEYDHCLTFYVRYSINMDTDIKYNQFMSLFMSSEPSFVNHLKESIIDEYKRYPIYKNMNEVTLLEAYLRTYGKEETNLLDSMMNSLKISSI